MHVWVFICVVALIRCSEWVTAPLWLMCCVFFFFYVTYWDPSWLELFLVGVCLNGWRVDCKDDDEDEDEDEDDERLLGTSMGGHGCTRQNKGGWRKWGEKIKSLQGRLWGQVRSGWEWSSACAAAPSINMILWDELCSSTYVHPPLS